MEVRFFSTSGQLQCQTCSLLYVFYVLCVLLNGATILEQRLPI